MVEYNSEINKNREANIDRFLEVAQQFNEEFKEEIEKEKEEYLKE